MRKIIYSFSLILMLTACGNESDIKDVIKNELKDPGSAQFKEIVFNAEKDRACAQWNAKNSVGGYGDWLISELKKESNEWKISELKGSVYNCDEIGFKIVDAKERSKLEASSDLLKILKNNNIKSENLSTDLYGIVLNNFVRCKNTGFRFISSMSHLAEVRVRYGVSSKEAKAEEETVNKYKSELEKSLKDSDYVCEHF